MKKTELLGLVAMEIPRPHNCHHANAWPQRNKMPSAVAVVHQTLNLERSPAFRACRERSSTMLEISSTTVFTQRMGGLGVPAQSSERPRRITNAVVNAANTMAVAASSTNSPANAVRLDEPSGPGLPPPPHPCSMGGGGGPWRAPCVTDAGIPIWMRQPSSRSRAQEPKSRFYAGRDQRYWNVFPSKKAVQRERAKLHEMTDSRQCFKPISTLIGELNRHLKRWANYFSFGYPSGVYWEIDWYVRGRLIQRLQRRSQRPFRPPEEATWYQHLEQLWLVCLSEHAQA